MFNTILTSKLSRAWRLGIVALAFIFAAPAMNAEETDCLAVHFKNGEKIYYVLAEKPVATFVGDKLHINATEISDEHDMSTVEKFTFGLYDPSSVTELEAGASRITLIDKTLTLEGFTAGAEIAIFDIRGVRVVADAIGADGVQSVSLASLAGGVYIVTVDSKSFKIRL